MRYLPLCIVALLFGIQQVRAQEFAPSIRWFGDVRVRSEVDMRDFNQRTPPNTITLLRTRLGFEAVPFEDVRVFIQARDSRAFGQEASTLADSRNLDLHQGFVEIKKLFADPLMLRLGRQELSYGNERIIGTVGWHNVGRVFDGGLLRVDVDAVTLDLFAMNIREVQPYVAIATPLTVQPVKDEGADFFGSYITLKNLASHTLNGYAFYEWHRSSATILLPRISRATIGSHAKGRVEAIDYEAEVAYQGGKIGSLDVSAYLLTGAVGYNMPGSVLSRIAAGADVLSGTAGGTKYKTFDPVFHTGHKFYGFMDYFVNIPSNTQMYGLVDLLARTALTFSEKVNLNIWFHHFAHHQSVAGHRALGQEIDMVLNLRYNKAVTFELGVSTFLPAAIMRDRFGGSDAAFWGYLMTTVAF
jgi:hypothetical protein